MKNDVAPVFEAPDDTLENKIKRLKFLRNLHGTKWIVRVTALWALLIVLTIVIFLLLAFPMATAALATMRGTEVPDALRRTPLIFGLGLLLGGLWSAVLFSLERRWTGRYKTPAPAEFALTEPPVLEHETWDSFDPSDPKYPHELDIAFQAWRAVYINPKTGTIKEQLAAWIKETYPQQSAKSIARIVTISNWDKGGGRPRQF